MYSRIHIELLYQPLYSRLTDFMNLNSYPDILTIALLEPGV